jgi:hypothetical protein
MGRFSVGTNRWRIGGRVTSDAGTVGLSELRMHLNTTVETRSGMLPLVDLRDQACRGVRSLTRAVGK